MSSSLQLLGRFCAHRAHDLSPCHRTLRSTYTASTYPGCVWCIAFLADPRISVWPGFVPRVGEQTRGADQQQCHGRVCEIP